MADVGGGVHDERSRGRGEPTDEQGESEQDTVDEASSRRRTLEGQDRHRQGGEGDGSDGTPREAEEFPGRDRPQNPVTEVGSGTARTHLFTAQHAERYGRQAIIEKYEALVGARLIVMIDQIFADGVTLLEELLMGCNPETPLHVMLATPGGDGEVAIRLVRAMQARCSHLTIIVPDMAKSAGTIMCLGADALLMGPSSDLGPVDPQFLVGGSLVGAKEIDQAVTNAELRVQAAPDTYPLFSGLLADVNMLMVEQARSAMARSYDLIREALGCAGRDDAACTELADRLTGPLVDEATVHGSTLGPQQAFALGLPVVHAEPDGEQWQLIWALWTRYFTLGAFPAGSASVYEGRRASQVIGARHP